MFMFIHLRLIHFALPPCALIDFKNNKWLTYFSFLLCICYCFSHLIGFLSVTWLSLLYKFTLFLFLLLSDEGSMLQTLDYTISVLAVHRPFKISIWNTQRLPHLPAFDTSWRRLISNFLTYHQAYTNWLKFTYLMTQKTMVQGKKGSLHLIAFKSRLKLSVNCASVNVCCFVNKLRFCRCTIL